MRTDASLILIVDIVQFPISLVWGSVLRGASTCVRCSVCQLCLWCSLFVCSSMSCTCFFEDNKNANLLLRWLTLISANVEHCVLTKILPQIITNFREFQPNHNHWHLLTTNLRLAFKIVNQRHIKRGSKKKQTHELKWSYTLQTMIPRRSHDADGWHIGHLFS